MIGSRNCTPKCGLGHARARLNSQESTNKGYKKKNQFFKKFRFLNKPEKFGNQAILFYIKIITNRLTRVLFSHKKISIQEHRIPNTGTVSGADGNAFCSKLQ